MKEYIEREAAIEQIDFYWKQAYNAGFLDAAVRLGSVYREIENIPAADVREVRRGRWIKCRPASTIDGSYYCPCCGHEIDIADGEITPADVGFLYCPNCGADMKGEAE